MTIGDEDVIGRAYFGRRTPDCLCPFIATAIQYHQAAAHTFITTIIQCPLPRQFIQIWLPPINPFIRSVLPICAINKGAKFFPYQVTRLEECPSVLVECGYLTNVSDCNVLISEGGQELISGAIANGILYYLNNF